MGQVGTPNSPHCSRVNCILLYWKHGIIGSQRWKGPSGLSCPTPLFNKWGLEPQRRSDLPKASQLASGRTKPRLLSARCLDLCPAHSCHRVTGATQATAHLWQEIMDLEALVTFCRHSCDALQAAQPSGVWDRLVRDKNQALVLRNFSLGNLQSELTSPRHCHTEASVLPRWCLGIHLPLELNCKKGHGKTGEGRDLKMKQKSLLYLPCLPSIPDYTSLAHFPNHNTHGGFRVVSYLSAIGLWEGRHFRV